MESRIGEVRKVHVVYFLSRGGQVEHQHLIKVQLVALNGDGDCSNCHDDDNCQNLQAEMEPPVEQSQNLQASNSQSILYQPLQPVTLKVQ